MAQRFAGRRALVTGASRGIGAAVAQRLAAEGADVAIVARTKEPNDQVRGSLDQTVERLASYGTRVVPIVADLSDPERREQVVPSAVEALGGPVEILVNNAAAAVYRRLGDFPLRQRRLLFEVNVHAPLDLAAAVLPDMRASGEGWIVNLTSVAAEPVVGPPFEVGQLGGATTMYGASKAALERMSNGLAVETQGSGIRVNAVAPRAAVLTEGAEAFLRESLPPEKIESLEEMVEAVVALCDCPADVTGRSLVSLDLLDEWGLGACGLDGREQ